MGLVLVYSFIISNNQIFWLLSVDHTLPSEEYELVVMIKLLFSLIIIDGILKPEESVTSLLDPPKDFCQISFNSASVFMTKTSTFPCSITSISLPGGLTLPEK